MKVCLSAIGGVTCERGWCVEPGGCEGGEDFFMGSVDLEADSARRRLDVVQWLNSLFPELKIPPVVSDEELRAELSDGVVFAGILSKINPNFANELGRYGDIPSPDKKFLSVKQFISALDQLGLPSFNVSELEHGPLSIVVLCLLSLRDHLNLNAGTRNEKFLTRNENLSRFTWKQQEGSRQGAVNASQREYTQGGQNYVLPVVDRRKDTTELSFQHLPINTSVSESTAFSHHVGHKFHEVFQIKQGCYSDLPAAKISEMLKSSSLDNAPTQSLLGLVNDILNESIERKNGEIPHRVACLLRKVVQEIERRISTQAEHIRNQNNLIKAREEKYQSRIKVLETLATGTNEETQTVMNQLHQVKSEKNSIEERKKLDEQDVIRLMKEKNSSEQIILELQQELETSKRAYEVQCQQLETKALETKMKLEERLKEQETLLEESRKKTKELETLSESKFQNWTQKEQMFNNFTRFQLRSVQNIRAASDLIKQEVRNTQNQWVEELGKFGSKLKVLVDAAEDYRTILEENRKLFNEVQELKGNIRVYCRIRPFLPGQSKKLTTIDYIGENGELLTINPSKTGKDAHRMFKFNKVFGPSATQEEVFMDTQPLVRSVLDGYNVCIFAYGQTGSGKTFTMSGPNSSSKVDWGVNYRALNDLFNISRDRSSTIMYEVGVQMVEIYNEQVRDLLANESSHKRLGIWSTSQPNGLAVPDAIMHPVKSTQDVLDLMKIGQANRAVGATALNERSSRSHSVLTVHVRGMDMKTGAALRGSLHLVDLAGSERVDRSEVTGERLKEAQHINKSLSALGDVIFALSQKSAHVPYRNSKLTQVLQSSLGGQAKTLMFVQINPDVESYSETISTLKFAERVSGVELGAARSSKEGKDVRDLMGQVAALKDTIARKDEEIEQLQRQNDLGSQSPGKERLRNISLKHSASSPGIRSLVGRKLSSGMLSSVIKAASDPEFSDYSDRHSDVGSHQSVDDFKHQKDNLGLRKFTEEEASRVDPDDVELIGLGDADADERLSDISDSVLSMGTETDGSVSSAVEFALFPESKLEKKSLLQPRTSKSNMTKMAQISTSRPKSHVIRISSTRKNTSNLAMTSAAKSSKTRAMNQ